MASKDANLIRNKDEHKTGTDLLIMHLSYPTVAVHSSEVKIEGVLLSKLRVISALLN